MALLDTNIEETLDADGNTTAVTHHGGIVSLGLQGDFGGGTATLQASYDGGTTWGTATDIITGNTLAVAAGTTGVAYAGTLNLPACQIRVNLASSTSPDLDVRATRQDGPLTR